MATATMNWSPMAGRPGDGSSGNAGPQFTTIIGTETNPKKMFVSADFDSGTDEHLWFTFTLPQNYASGGTFRLMWRSAAATSNSCVWGARVGAVTPADADTPAEHAQAAATTTTTATNTTEAGRLNTTTIAPSMDSAAAGDLIFFVIYRDADNGSDTLVGDAQLISVSFDFTTT